MTMKKSEQIAREQAARLIRSFPTVRVYKLTLVRRAFCPWACQEINDELEPVELVAENDEDHVDWHLPPGRYVIVPLD